MKITIDTKEDSHEEIKRVIDILSSMVGVNGAAGNNAALSGSASQQPEAPRGGIFDMFSADNREENAPFANPELPTSEEVGAMFSDNREETVNLPEPKVVEGVKGRGSDDDTRIIVY